MDTDTPVPPVALTARLAQAPTAWRDVEGYLERGRQALRAIERILPDEWTWSNKRVLDFGCGAGRVVRHLRDIGAPVQVWGCDIDPACIAWNTENLGPSISFFVNDLVPPLPFESDTFDLVYSLSVFTHIDRHWASWLLELHRVLAPGGILVATIMSEGMCEAVSGEEWDESKVGMNVYESGQPWELGGPMVLHSPWWIREHWGRLFHVVEVRARDVFDQSGSGAQDDHGAAVLQKSGVTTVTVAELERLNPSEPREASALSHDVLHLRSEVAALRAEARRTQGT
ncbi:MAG: class I SAM-dependent methyltransferase [Acidimicrobiales bacterium]|jgi:SAM-dependent methyltransferase